MKKTIFILTIIMLITIISGCGNSAITMVKPKDDSSLNKSSSSSVVSSSSNSINNNSSSSSLYSNTLDGKIANPDFRNIKWGMTKEEVIKCEGGEPSESDDKSLVYKNIQISNYNSSLMYGFQDGKLYLGSYHLNEKHTNSNDYINDFNDLKTKYIEVYGNLKLDKTIWKNDLFKDDKSYYGTAIASGHLAYLCQWETNTTDITLALFGDNLQITNMIQYKQKGFVEKSNTNGI